MAEIIIPEGYGEAKLIWSMAGKTNPITSTIGYAGATTPPSDCAEAIYEYATLNGSICDGDLMGSIFTFEGVEVMQNVDGDLMGGAAYAPVVGTYVATAFPPVNCTYLASKRSAYIGRWARGRMYLPNTGAPESTIDTMGRIESITFASVSSQVITFSNAICGATIAGAFILHSEVGRLPTPVTTIALQNQLATQRRRMRS